jgi:hypothetical protein
MVKSSHPQEDPILYSSALKRVRGIHQLSSHYNQLVGKVHEVRLLELMAHHVAEIEELLRLKDKHFLVETGDLAVLCLELLLEYRASPDKILNECFGRYERKLNSLLAEIKEERKFKSTRQTNKRKMT